MAEVAARSPEGSRPAGSGSEAPGAGAAAALGDIKTEEEVRVKPEHHECCVCAALSDHCCDMFERRSAASGAPLHALLVRFAGVDPASRRGATSHVCAPCADLLDVLERAEIEYSRLKRDFELIISKNPLFASLPPSEHPEQLHAVKDESLEVYPESELCDTPPIVDDDSENEPLAVTKKKRHKPFKKKRSSISSNRNVSKRKKDSWNQWECPDGGARGTGGTRGQQAHDSDAHCQQIKTEEETILPDINYRNGYSLVSSKVIKLEIEGPDGSQSILSQLVGEKSRGRPRKEAGAGGAHPRARRPKTMHSCDQCDSKFSSLARLDLHKSKHSGSKAPYICEVCGAHYKHRRACDIHIAMHKGISDWKCELCNKLFPSKGALHRHNNIHTGKTNYQCDQCGKSFIHTSSFKMHKLAHSGVKPHKCGVCGLALMTSSHLKRHLRIHSGEKRYECAVCGKRFSERYNLAAHEKSHATPTEQAPERAVRRGCFRCHFCAERYERRYMLERHMTQAHGRTLERPPARPRNTMSKLLKAQAQAKLARATAPPPADDIDTELQVKQSESRPESRDSQPLAAAAKSSPLGGGAVQTWSNFPTDYARLADYPH